MILAHGEEIGWEHFERPPACRGSDDYCDECSMETRWGYLEMESETWYCHGCFNAMLVEMLTDEIKDLESILWGARAAMREEPAGNWDRILSQVDLFYAHFEREHNRVRREERGGE